MRLEAYDKIWFEIQFDVCPWAFDDFGTGHARLHLTNIRINAKYILILNNLQLSINGNVIGQMKLYDIRMVDSLIRYKTINWNITKIRLIWFGKKNSFQGSLWYDIVGRLHFINCFNSWIHPQELELYYMLNIVKNTIG